MIDTRPPICRNRLRDENKPYPKSGCGACGNGGLMGCPFEGAVKTTYLYNTFVNKVVDDLVEKFSTLKDSRVTLYKFFYSTIQSARMKFDMDGLPRPNPITEELRGKIAYALTKRLVIDMPTARAAVDEALEEMNKKTEPEKLVDKYCEGWCQENGGRGKFEDCTGCEIHSTFIAKDDSSVSRS